MSNPVIALVGNPNSGKTTLFNLLTKSGEAVGNRAGVTFSAKKEPLARYGKHAWILDLPGIYSLSSCRNEEKAAMQALKNEHIDVIINIVDAGNLERGLFLTLALLRLGIPTVVALNMMDELPKCGLQIDHLRLEKELGVPVFPISAAKAQGIEKLMETSLSLKDIPSPLPFANRADCGMKIRDILSVSVRKSGKRTDLQDHIDRILCRPIIGIPFFFLVMSVVFFLTFSSLGNMASAWLESLFSAIAMLIEKALLHIGVEETLCHFLIEGVWMGVAAVLAFIPQTAILFFLLAILEDSGYLARAAFVMDGMMRRFGVSGKAVIPLLIGFGCTVPAVMSASTLEENEQERMISALPFIPCNARLPIIVMISSTFFPTYQASFAIFLYLFCLFTAFLSLILSRKQGENAPPLIMELPKYRTPRPVSLFREVQNKLRDFLVRAGTVVFLSCVIVNLLAILTPNFHFTEENEKSILALFGNGIAPFFSFLGFSDGRLFSALIAGFFAKESIVSTLKILVPEGIASILSPTDAITFAIFSLLYLPCAATVSAIRERLGSKKTLLLISRTLAFACSLSYLISTLLHFLSK